MNVSIGNSSKETNSSGYSVFYLYQQLSLGESYQVTAESNVTLITESPIFIFNGSKNVTLMLVERGAVVEYEVIVFLKELGQVAAAN